MAEEENGQEAEGTTPDAKKEEEGAPTLSEDELRERLEEEIRNLKIEDVLLQSVVSILNLSARRIAKEDERDLEQGRIGIEAVRALLPLLGDEAGEPVRQALSELQMLYARHAGEPGEEPETGKGPEKPDSGLWTPSDSG